MRKKILLAFTLALLPLQVFAGDFWYPFNEIAKSDCRRIVWSELGADCKMPVPRIEMGNYEKYKSNTLYRRVYSVLWGSTYDYGWDSGYGSHQGVDIATSEGTPVVAIGEWLVVTAANLSGWGNSVTIKHTLSDKTVIYSNYSHLSSITVNKGDTVAKWQMIGWVWSTGHSYGNHLHFQIDITDQSHPYYFVTCAKGKNELAVVNSWLCRDFLIANTIDPILFLETGNLSTVPTTKAIIDQIKQNNTPVKISPTTIETRQKILEDEANEYLKNYTIDIDIPPTGVNITVGSTYWATVSVKDPKGNPPKGNLPEAGLVIGYDTKGLQILPSTAVALDDGKRSVSIIGKAPGSYEVKFSLGSKVLWVRKIYVIKKGEVIEPVSMEIRAARSLTLGGETDIYFVPKSKFGSYIVDTPYNSRFRVQILKGKPKFCNLSHSQKTACDPTLVMESFEFGYGDTYRGYFKGKMVPLDSAPVSFSITRIGDAKPIGVIRRDLVVKNPTNLTKANVYYESVVAGIKKNWQGVKNGYAYEWYEVTTPHAESLISRMLAYRVLKSWNNVFIKKEAKKQIERFQAIMKTQFFKTWTRGEFADLLMKSLSRTTTQPSSSKQPYLDETGPYKDVISLLRREYQFKWQDEFGERYFQPDKVITVQEALYLMGEVVKD